jgi:hypothetical protein
MTIADDIKEAMGGDFTDLVTVSINWRFEAAP